VTKPYLRGRIWWIKYPIGGGKFRYESSKSSDYEEAKLFLARKLTDIEEVGAHVAKLRRDGLTTQIGCAAELLVCADLVSSDCEVFRAVGMHSSCDVVALKNGILKRVEVKTGIIKRNNKFQVHFAKNQRTKSDIVAVVDRAKGIRYFPPLEEAFRQSSYKVVSDVTNDENLENLQNAG